jgi:hypothetical protein
VEDTPILVGDALAAVRHRGSHVQIIASAGSGKTEVAQRYKGVATFEITTNRRSRPIGSSSLRATSARSAGTQMTGTGEPVKIYQGRVTRYSAGRVPEQGLGARGGSSDPHARGCSPSALPDLGSRCRDALRLRRRVVPVYSAG